ncbi:MAG: CocE/NonD family hydrolase [Bacteroidia bacterium]|nr:CocE/NonD family hydrolase [Bacteroidia bacterium]
MLHAIPTIRTLALCICLSLPSLAAFSQIPYQETDIPVRDGKTLKADLYIGGGIDRKPVILVQTPYNRLVYRVSLGRKGSNFPLDTSAYHYVFVDWRGFYGSAAAAVPGYDRGLDGYDIVEWLAAQPWCNGKIGTYGGSALGMIQFQTARHKPPHLVCAAPAIIDYRTEYSDYYCQGVLRYEHVQSLERLGFTSSALITSRPAENAVWDLIRNQSDYPEEIAVPLLMCSGWFDHYPADVLRAFADLRTRSDARVRSQHKLLMGPWTHSEVDLETQGDLRFPEAVDVFRDAALQFFAYHLLGAKNGWPLQPALRYFQMGENSWETADGWDARPAIPYTLHLHSDGSPGRADGIGCRDAHHVLRSP